VGSDRVLAILAELARHPAGIGFDDMSRAVDSAKPTVHRALASLRRAGFARQDGYGRYVLGDELLRLAFTYHEARPEQLRVQEALSALCDEFGETVHYAVLEGDHVVYRVKLDPAVGAMKLGSTIGGHQHQRPRPPYARGGSCDQRGPDPRHRCSQLVMRVPFSGISYDYPESARM
jgi:DNA-binding IclR family transcriptional regulator